jgi:transcription termination factor Rho
MAEYLTRDTVEAVALNAPIPFIDSIRCAKGYVYHQGGTGIFVLRGITSNCFARYNVEFTGNIAIPEGGAVTPIATAIVVSGEERAGSRSIFTPAAVDEY